MKKFLALLLVMMLIMTSFTACGSKDDAEGETPDTNLEQDVEVNGGEVEGDAEADAEDGAEDADEETADEEDEPAKEEEKKEEASDKQDEQKPAESKPADKKPEADKDKNDKKEEDKKEEKPSSDNSGSGAASVAGTPAEIIEKIYGVFPVADLPLGTIEIDLADPDALMMFTGLSSADKIAAAAASESMMGAQAYSLVVVKVKDAKDAEAVATEMMNGIDQRKWICVEADDLRVAAAGDTVVLMMIGSAHADVATAKDIIDAFGSVAGGLDLNKTK